MPSFRRSVGHSWLGCDTKHRNRLVSTDRQEQNSRPHMSCLKGFRGKGHVFTFTLELFVISLLHVFFYIYISGYIHIHVYVYRYTIWVQSETASKPNGPTHAGFAHRMFVALLAFMFPRQIGSPLQQLVSVVLAGPNTNKKNAPLATLTAHVLGPRARPMAPICVEARLLGRRRGTNHVALNSL